jgi:predicted Ser/Thr protein kinase
MKKLNCNPGNYQCGGRCMSTKMKCRSKTTDKAQVLLDNTSKLINNFNGIDLEARFFPKININDVFNYNARIFNKEDIDSGLNDLINKHLGKVNKLEVVIEDVDNIVNQAKYVVNVNQPQAKINKTGQEINKLIETKVNTPTEIIETTKELEKKNKAFKDLVDLKKPIGGKMIGKGEMGAAYLVNVNGNEYVVKEGRIDDSEIEVLKVLEERGVNNVVKVLADGKGEGRGIAAKRRIIMNKAQGEPIANMANSEKEAAKKSPKIFNKVKELHDIGVAHGDLHQGNIFYDKNKSEVNLIDFGLAKKKAKPAEIVGDMLKLVNQGFENKNEPELIKFFEKHLDLTGDYANMGLREIMAAVFTGKVKYNMGALLSDLDPELFREFYDIYYKGY